MTKEGKQPLSKPKVSKELEQAERQFQAQEENIRSMTLDRMNEAPKQELEPQTKLSQNEIANSKDVYLKPVKRVSSREKFNEKFRENYEFDKEYVYFIAENKELIGETIEMWTKPYPGLPAEFWQIPVNKPIWAPRYVAEQIKRKFYHRLVTDQKKITDSDGMAEYTGMMVVDTTIPRLDAYPATKRRSVFMGANNF